MAKLSRRAFLKLGGIGGLGGEEVAESVEPALGGRALLPEPGLGEPEAGGLGLVAADPADLLGPHEAGRLEHLQVLEHGGHGHGQGLGQLGDRCGAADEALDERTPRGIRERLEGQAERVQMLKHLLK